MKKSFLFIVLFLIGISYFDAKAVDCPPGYYGTFTLLIPDCGDCYWEIEWCCADLIGPSTVPQIFIKSIVLKSNNPNDPCTCVPTIQTINGVRPVIPWNAIITGIIGSGKGCFSTLPPIPNCEDTNALQIKITNGGCYRYIIDLNGQVITEGNFKYIIDMSSVNSGIYFIRIYFENDVITKKIIKE